jgi:hypothetical protein
LRGVGPQWRLERRTYMTLPGGRDAVQLAQLGRTRCRGAGTRTVLRITASSMVGDCSSDAPRGFAAMSVGRAPDICDERATVNHQPHRPAVPTGRSTHFRGISQGDRAAVQNAYPRVWTRASTSYYNPPTQPREERVLAKGKAGYLQRPPQSVCRTTKLRLVRSK